MDPGAIVQPHSEGLLGIAQRWKPDAFDGREMNPQLSLDGDECVAVPGQERVVECR